MNHKDCITSGNRPILYRYWNPFVVYILPLSTFFLACPAYFIFDNSLLPGYSISGANLRRAMELQFGCNFVFISVAIVSYACLSMFHRRSFRLFVDINFTPRLSRELLFALSRFALISRLLLFCVSVSVISYFILYGLQKIHLLGTDISSSEFRFVGFDDVDTFSKISLELSRKIIIPFLLLLSCLKSKVRSASRSYFSWLGLQQSFLIALQLIASFSTLDRGPFLSLFAVLLFVWICVIPKNTAFKILIAAPIFTLALGALTFVQYNILDFSLSEALRTGQAFFVGRIISDPSLTAAQFSFDLFPLNSSPLFLAYSRLSFLVTGAYVGSASNVSVFVTPVGLTGDIWRNFGFPGIFFLSLLMASFFFYLDSFLRPQVDSFGCIIASLFVVLSSLYAIYGVLFSMGGVVFFLSPVLVLFLTRLRWSVARARA